MNPPLLRVQNLSHTYRNGDRGLADISFTVHPGEFIVVAGRNGSGKSTLFRHLNGLQSPTGGAVFLHGQSVAKQGRNALRTVGLVFQHADMQIVGETVWDDVLFGPGNLKQDLETMHAHGNRALTAMNLLHLKDRDPASLSGGEKKRLAIAGVLAMAPEILILDEPFSSLDDPGTTDLIRAITDLHGQGHTILISTHDIEKIIDHATRLMLLSRGRLVRDGRPRELMGALASCGVREPCSSRMGLGITPWLADPPADQGGMQK